MTEMDMMEIEYQPENYTLPATNGSTKTLATNEVCQGKKRALTQDDVKAKCQSYNVDHNRRRLRGKRTIARANERGDAVALEKLVVLDTNVLIQNLDDLKRIPITFKGNLSAVKFVVPWIVLQELDGLKKGNNPKITNAIKFINNELEEGSRFKSDIALIRMRSTDSSDPLSLIENANLSFNTCNDDALLKQCLILRKVNQGNNVAVYLVSNDINLRNKAIAVELKAASWSQFAAQCLRSIPSTEKNPGLLPAEPSCVPCVNQPDEIDMQISDIPDSNSNIADKPALNSRMEANSEKKQVKCVLLKDMQTVLSKFIESVLREQYGEKLWCKIFEDVNVQTASLSDLFKLLKRGWIGCFSDVFNRSPYIQKEIEVIDEAFRKGKSADDLSKTLTDFFKKVPKIEGKTDVQTERFRKRRKTD